MHPERFHRLRTVLERRQPDLTILMDRVNKSHNFSAILRNCDACLLYTSDAADDSLRVDLGGRRII